MDLIYRGRVMTDYLRIIGNNDSYKAKFEALYKAVDESPAVDAKPVLHATWRPIIDDETCFTDYMCSNCGRTEKSTQWLYCRCGAKMMC